MAFSKQTAETAGLTYGTCGREGGREDRADSNSKPPPMNLCREAIPVGEGGGGAVGKASPCSFSPRSVVAAMSFVAYCRPQAPLVNRVRSRKIESSLLGQGFHVSVWLLTVAQRCKRRCFEWRLAG